MMRSIKDKLVAISGASKRRSGILDDARPTSEDDTATTFELFFDLVYVFAMTQVTGYMVHAHDSLGVLQGLLVLALLWWTWSAYAWLGNQARADTGVVRRGPHCPGSLERRRWGPRRTTRIGRRLPDRAVRAPGRLRAGSARRPRAAPAAGDFVGSACGRGCPARGRRPRRWAGADFVLRRRPRRGLGRHLPHLARG